MKKIKHTVKLGKEISSLHAILHDTPKLKFKSPDTDKLQMRVLDSKTIVYFRQNVNADEKMDNFKDKCGKVQIGVN